MKLSVSKTAVALGVGIVLLCATNAVFAEGSADKAKGGKEIVTFITLDASNFKGALEQFVAEFNAANPGIEVQPTFSAAFGQQVPTELETGSEHDIILSWNALLTPYILNDKFAEVPADTAKKVKEALYDYALVPAMSKGKLYGIPSNFYPWLGTIMYNPDLYAKAGVDPKNAKTWDEFMQMAQKATIRDANGKMVQSGFSAQLEVQSYFYSWTLQLGGKLFNEDGTAAFNSPEGRKALQLFADIYQKWKVDDYDFGKTSANFKKGTAAATKGMPWFAATIAQELPDLKYAFAPMPNVGTGPAYWALPEVWMYVVSKKAGNRPAVWKFLEFLMTPDIAARWSAFAGELSPVKAIKDDPRITKSPFLADFVSLMPLGVSKDIINWQTDDTVKAIQIMTESVGRGKESVDSAITKAAAEVDRIAKRLTK